MPSNTKIYKIVEGKVVKTYSGQGWYAQQHVAYAFPYFNYGDAANREQASALVAKGSHRWKLGQGWVLALVAADSALLLGEKWIEEDPPGSGKFREASAPP